MRISVDRYPGQPERSNALYRARPLRWEELDLAATCDGEPMTWQPKADRDAFKEAWLCFENDRARFPLYPGQHATVSYSYVVDDGRWGPWFQRAVRLPTSHLSVDLIFPAALDLVVWGTETGRMVPVNPDWAFAPMLRVRSALDSAREFTPHAGVLAGLAVACGLGFRLDQYQAGPTAAPGDAVTYLPPDLRQLITQTQITVSFARALPAVISNPGRTARARCVSRRTEA